MNKQEIYNALWTLTKEKHNASFAQVQAASKEHPTERGALQLKAGIYNVALAAGLASGTGNATEVMCKRFRNLIVHFPILSSYYDGLSCEEKEIMEVSLCPEMFMRLNFYGAYVADLEEAEKEGEPEKIFKARIKKEVLSEILEMWRNFRTENNLFVFAFKDKEVYGERKA